MDPLRWALSSGEEFELLFTAPPHMVAALEAAANLPLTVIGEVIDGAKVEVVDESGGDVRVESAGWDHFAK
jgi:thiamine-monophosphate kinase